MKFSTTCFFFPLFADSAFANTRGIPFPFYRFKFWSDLDQTAVGHATTLGYEEFSWNSPGEAEIELLKYDNITATSAEQGSALDGLGFDQPVWDCWSNHYSGYLWDELASEGVQQYLAALGWTEASWLEEIDPPNSEDAFWDELEPEEQAAALEICYTLELWNGLSLDLWTEFPMTPEPTSSPTTTPTIPAVPSSTSPPTASPVAQSPSPSGMPSITLTDSPTQSPSTPRPTSSTSPTMMPTGPTTLPPAPEIPSVEDVRYVSWGELSDDIKMNAEALVYTEETWNNPGSATIESYSFDFIDKAGVPGGTAAITAMGIDSVQWDCYINHYNYYSWNDLAAQGVQVYLRALGWSEESWTELIDAPESDTLGWVNLTAREQQAAEGLCYRMETWDLIPLPEWVTDSVPTVSPVATFDPVGAEPTSSPVGSAATLASVSIAGVAMLLGLAMYE